jgi:hypothetical protein
VARLTDSDLTGAFLHSSLERGGNFWRLLSESIDFDAGSTVSTLDRVMNVSPGDLENFSATPKQLPRFDSIRARVQTVLQPAISVIRAFLAGPAELAIVGHPGLTRNDRVPVKDTGRYWYYADDVALALGPEESEEDRLSTAMQAGFAAWSAPILLTSYTIDIADSTSLSEDATIRMVEGAVAVALWCYDGWGHVIWAADGFENLLEP